MATTEHFYTGNNSTTSFAFTFPYLANSDVKVELDNVVKTENSSGQTNNDYTINNTNIVFNTAPGSGVSVHIYRSTNVDTAQATYAAGSSIRAVDLNNNQTQVLYSSQERENQLIRETDLADSIITSAKIVDGGIATVDLADSLITTAKINAAAVTGAKIANDQINSEHYVDGSIDEQHIANSAVTSNKIADNAVTTTEILNGAVTTAKLAADAIDGTKLADNAVDSEHYTDGSIDRVHLEADIIDSTKLADNAVNSEHYVDGSIDRVHLEADIIDSTKLADDAVRAEHIQANAVTDSEIATGTLDNRYFTETELTGGALDGRYFTETESDARYFNISTGDTIKDGDTFPDNDTTIATTAAINDRIIDLVDDVGGFVPIANETSFPNANPDVNNGTGTLVSIKALSQNLTSNGSGQISISNGTVGNSTVTITGAANSTTYAATFGMIVETTTTLNTYTFHRLVPKATEVTTVAGNVGSVNTVAGAISNVNAVAGNASNINTVAGINANVTTVAGISSNVTSVANNSSNINAVQGNATNINAVAGNNSNITAVAGNASNINSAVSNASNINSAVSNASNITTVAGSISNVNTTAGSISNVNSVASNMANVNNFADRYQIASNNPSTDGGGNALAAGDLYFNTSANELKVYNGSSWQGGVTASGTFAATTGNTFTGDNRYNDNVKALFGTGSDFEIFHNGSGRNIIGNNATQIRLITDTLRMATYTGDEIYLLGDLNGSVDLYYDNSKKLETTSTGIDVTGRIFGDTISLGSTGTSFDALFQFSNNTAYSATGTNAEVAIGNANSSAATNSTGIHMFTDGNGRGIVNLNACNNSTNSSADFVVQTRHSGTLGERLRITSDGNIRIPADNKKLQIGAGQDLEIFHDGSDSKIVDAGTGVLILQSNETKIINSGNSETIARFIENGETSLWYDNSKKFETTSTGAKVTGNLNLDDASIYIGLSSDLRLHHDGTNSAIVNSTGNLYINATTHEVGAKIVANGAVELYYNNNKTFETRNAGCTITGGLTCGGATFSGAVNLPDNYVFSLGTSNDLQLYHNGSNSYISNRGAGVLVIEADTGENGIVLTQNGAVDLYYDHSKKLETTSGGVLVQGGYFFDTDNYITCNNTSNTMEFVIGDANVAEFNSTALHFADSKEARFGAGNDLRIYHNGSGSYISDVGTGSLYIQGENLILENTSGTNYFAGVSGAEAILYHNGNTKFETKSFGAQVTGELYSDGLRTGDNEKLQLGDGQDLQIYHDGSSSYIKDNSNQLYIRANAAIKFENDAGSETFAKFHENGNCELYHDNSKKFETTSGGVTVTGELYSDGLRTGDNEKLQLGDGQDLQIFHDGTKNRINSSNHPLTIKSGSTFKIVNGDGTEELFEATTNGSVELSYDNSKKFETTSGGVTVTGTLSTAGVSLSSGAGAISVGAGDDIRFTNGGWTGETAGKIQQHSNWLYFQGGSNGFQFRSSGGTDRLVLDSSGHLRPAANNTYDLGTSSYRWRNIYTNDLNLSNQGSSNEMDGTWGDWTIQEGESDLFLKNNRSGKKYKFNLTEVS